MTDERFPSRSRSRTRTDGTNRNPNGRLRSCLSGHSWRVLLLGLDLALQLPTTCSHSCGVNRTLYEISTCPPVLIHRACPLWSVSTGMVVEMRAETVRLTGNPRRSDNCMRGMRCTHTHAVKEHIKRNPWAPQSRRPSRRPSPSGPLRMPSLASRCRRDCRRQSRQCTQGS